MAETDAFSSAKAGFDLFDELQDDPRHMDKVIDASDFIVDIREFDVPYHVRVAIDKGMFGLHCLTLPDLTCDI